MFNNCYTIPGINFAFPDVALTPIPSPVGPIPIPIPYPNTGINATALPFTTAMFVFEFFTPAHNVVTTLPMSLGDQPGFLGGITCAPIDMATQSRVTCSVSTCMGALPVVRMVDMTLQNLWNSVGLTCSPSQVNTLVLR
ncbi:MAG: DUF4150 domain-containing protein [Proteobacteria bacterium TMED51]|jgi:hypothetical protein|nr:MAG: DUF4150 domain-containing protein [Proteobacteria bacterium TMED51]|tara:strand:+ start:378 stop:794 length:417 start_codon:yes stop_codon:yes gene_type:complete